MVSEGGETGSRGTWGVQVLAGPDAWNNTLKGCGVAFEAVSYCPRL
jgi:hypothetical protein